MTFAYSYTFYLSYALFLMQWKTLLPIEELMFTFAYSSTCYLSYALFPLQWKIFFPKED